jgi:hypothetical protein
MCLGPRRLLPHFRLDDDDGRLVAAPRSDRGSVHHPIRASNKAMNVDDD